MFTDLAPRAKTLFDELMFVADEYITTPTAATLAKELGFDNYEPSDYDH